MKRTGTKQGKKYFAVSLLFLTSLLAIAVGVLTALAGNATATMVLAATGLSLLAISLGCLMVVMLRENRRPGKSEPLDSVEKATLGISATEILLWIFLAA